MTALALDAETGEITLNPDDLATFEQHETTIERGLATFVEVGESLASIRDGRLYRAEHDTFETYCQQRWGMSRTFAYDTIKSSETARTLSAIADTPPVTNEAQARALAPIVKDHGAEVAAEVLKHVAEQSTVTAKAITKAAQELATPAEPSDPADDDTFRTNLAAVIGPDYAATTHKYGAAVMGIRNACDEILNSGYTATFLAENIPDHTRQAVPRIRAALDYLDDFLAALESNA